MLFRSIDVRQEQDSSITLSQEFYSSSIGDVNIPARRMSEPDTNGLVKHEVSEGKKTLGEIQWLATQSAPLLAARCGILQRECVLGAPPRALKDIQELVRDARTTKFKELNIQRLPTVKRPEDLAVAIFGYSSHMNRTKCGSTGGILGVVAPPEFLKGEMAEAFPVMLRSWKLTRKAIGSNDAEVQSIHEAENQLYKMRILMGELCSFGIPFGRDWDSRVDACHRAIHGCVITDSRGGYDSVTLNESANLSLSSSRSAVQAFSLKDSLQDANTPLLWVASDWNRADSLTKVAPECRKPLGQFLKVRKWRVRFDPNFVVAAKKAERSAVQIVQDAHEQPVGTLWPSDHGTDDQDFPDLERLR